MHVSEWMICVSEIDYPSIRVDDLCVRVDDLCV